MSQKLSRKKSIEELEKRLKKQYQWLKRHLRKEIKLFEEPLTEMELRYTCEDIIKYLDELNNIHFILKGIWEEY
jgi:hypothetical protein